MSGHPSEFALMEAVEEQPDRARLAAVEAHLADCPACRARVAALSEERARFLAAAPSAPPAAVAAVRRERERPRPRSAWGWAFAGAGVAAAAAVLVVLLVPLVPAPDPAPSESGVRAKGASVRWFVQRAGRPQPAPEGFAFRVGDRIGVEVTAPAEAQVVLLAVDDRGQATVLAAPSGATSALVPADTPTTLPLSVLLTPPAEPVRLVVVLRAADGGVTTAAREIAPE